MEAGGGGAGGGAGASCDKFHYVYSSALDHKLQIKIGTLEGRRPKPEYDKLLSDPMLKFSGLYSSGAQCSDLYVTCRVLQENVPLALPVTTSYKSFTNRWNWNEWVTLPVHYSDLPRNASLAMTIYDCAGPGKLMVVGGTTISLFGKHGLFRQEHNFKVNKYCNLVDRIVRNRYKTEFFAVEFGAKGLPAKSLYSFLKNLGLPRSTLSSYMERAANSSL